MTTMRDFSASEAWRDSYDSWKTTEPQRPYEDAEELAQRQAEEEARERDWHDLEREAQHFADKYGATAMLHCVARALEPRKG